VAEEAEASKGISLIPPRGQLPHRGCPASHKDFVANGERLSPMTEFVNNFNE